MKSNYAKYYTMQTGYALALMFCSGTVLQAFLLERGFSDSQVYLYNAIIQIVQTTVMILSIFISDFIKQTKKLIGSCTLSLLLMFGAQFIILARVNATPPVTMFFVMVTLTYCCIGLQSVEGYRLPYKIMDIRDYGRAVGVSAAISKVFCFGSSILYSFMIVRYDYVRVNMVFFICATVSVVISAISCFALKEGEFDLPGNVEKLKEQSHKSRNNLQVFKNKAMYFLLFPNFIRGINTGIISLLATIGISQSIITTQTSSYMNIAMQIALFLGNIFFAYTCKKRSSVKKMMMIAAVVMGVFLPLSIVRERASDFIIGYLIVQFFLVIVDNSIPVLVTEMIPYEQMGAFTAVRLSIFAFGSFVISLILDWLLSAIGHVALFIVSSVLLIICCLSYYLVAVYVKKQELKKETICKSENA